MRNDSLITITVLHNDNAPIKYAYVYINDPYLLKNTKRINEIYFTDISRQVKLNRITIKKYHNKELLLRVEALGFSTKIKLLLNYGYDCIIQSNIPDKYPFIINEQKKSG